MKRSVLALFVSSSVAAAGSLPSIAHARPETVVMAKTFRPGTIVVRADERRLFYATGGGQALRYPQPTIVVKNEKRGFP